jgi:hypothetical protein
MTRLRATTPHAIPERPPIRLISGQQVRVERRDTEWPEFVFVTTGDGAGWAPQRRRAGRLGATAHNRAGPPGRARTPRTRCM